MHGRLDLPDLQPLFNHFDDIPVASISNSQRSPVPQADWRGTVYHGLPLQLHQPSKCSEGYFAFLGRISPEKRVDRAIAIAESLRVPLKIAAKVDREDARYFEREIKPLLNSPYVEFVGDIGERQKTAFLGGARALLFPIDWPEPFGLVMIEALACGTPVVACDCGSVPEVLEDGVTGFIVKDLEQAIAAAAKVDTLDRRACRSEFERRFCATRMARDYVEIYASLMERTSGVSLTANVALEEAP
jgi:glycosyltransferase involved in cell wall biosynthesis